MCIKEQIITLALAKVAEKNSLRKVQEEGQNIIYDHYLPLDGERLPSLRHGLLQVAVTKPNFPYIRIALKRTDTQQTVYQIDTLAWKDHNLICSTDNKPKKIYSSCSSWSQTKEFIDNIIAEYLAE